MSFRTCDHLKEDGVYCNSPVLRGRNYCYFHLNVRGRRLAQPVALGTPSAALGDAQASLICVAKTAKVA